MAAPAVRPAGAGAAVAARAVAVAAAHRQIDEKNIRGWDHTWRGRHISATKELTMMGSHMACKTHLDHGWNNTQKQSMSFYEILSRIPLVPAKTCKAKLIYNAFQTTGKL